MSNGQRPLLVRALWFLLVGWWLTPVLINVAWVIGLTIVLLPVTVTLITLAPVALSLRRKTRSLNPEGTNRQHGLLVRAVYFVFVGWWASFLWGNLAALFAITIVGLPIAIWMLNRLPYVLSLYRYA